MTKRLLSVAIALLMVLALVPMTVFAAEGDNAIAFRIDDIDVTDPQVGETFRVPVYLEPDSGVWTCQFVVEFDNRYLTTVSYDYTGAGTLYAAIEADYNNWNENENHLIGMPPETPNAEGPFGRNHDIGNAGQYYSSVAFIGNGSYDGIYSGGVLCFITYQWIDVPTEDTTLPLNILFVEGTNNLAGTSYYQPENVGIDNGEINVNITEPVVIDRSISYYTKVAANTLNGTPADSVEIDVPAVGNYIMTYVYIDLPEGGNWAANEIYLDYDENLFTARGIRNDETCLAGVISAMIAAGNTSSDNITGTGKPSYTPTQPKEGLEMGNYYTQLASYANTPAIAGVYQGCTVSGLWLIVRYDWKVVPTESQLKQDGNRYYTDMPLIVYDSFYSPNGQDFIAHENVTTADARIYVNFPTPVETYTVTFVDGLTNQTIEVMENVEAGTAITYPAAPDHEGYTFVGWNPASIDSLAADTTVVANYEVNKYTVTYNINGEYYTEQEYDFGAAVTAPAYTAPTGYTFSGWNVPETMPAEDITLDATLTPINYTITINYYRYSEVLQDWVALQSPVYITMAYGSLYDVTDRVPETIDGYELDNVVGNLTGNVSGDITIDAYYVEPYEPVAPALVGSTAELRNRATEDGKKDVRFIFTVVFNDANVNYNGEMVGKDPAYFEITALGATLTVNGKNVVVPAKNIYEMGDSEFTFTAVISGIQEKNWATTIQAVPYMTYVPVGGEAVTVYGIAIETTVNDIIAAD